MREDPIYSRHFRHLPELTYITDPFITVVIYISLNIYVSPNTGD